MENTELVGTPKQVAWASQIKAESIDSIRRASIVPGFELACEKMEEAIRSISDAEWIIACRHTLSLGLSELPGSGEQTVCQMKINDHQLLRDEQSRNPALRKGTANISPDAAKELRELFRSAQCDQLARR